MTATGKSLFVLAAGFAWACHAGADRPVRVDAEGVLRWRDDGAEVALLGVNYYAPFTVDHAAIRAMGRDHKQVIRDDVAHFRRLGLGCIRIHCFDRQFSDAEGALVDNAHLELLDFVIDECRRNDIYAVLTPIAWWGGGIWTERTRGFSDVYEMRQMTTDRGAWKAQARFLQQFAEHANRYTGKRYADDPAVLAFECINEPLYPKETPDELVTEYINALADALRASGTTKPIYYNSWQGRNAAAGKARIDGVTCSSYPTGLVNGRALEGPQLERARGSSLHPDDAIARKSRMVYEFDAADVPGSHMYPSMAKFFRSEGSQVAAQFQYDPLPLAGVNKNWQTHHLNLVYTPGKALSLAIAAEVFKRVPRGAPFGALPAAAAFPPFRSSGEEDLSEMATDEAFLYSNTTLTPPPRPKALTRVWGCGSSCVVTYGGSGAYFLDRAAAGVWRLQLYPDVFVAADPYSGTEETKVLVVPSRHAMRLRLPDLGDAFTVWPFDNRLAEDARAQSRDGTFDVTPGDYLLTRKKNMPNASVLPRAAAVAPRYAAPQPEVDGKPLLRAVVPLQWRAGCPLNLCAEAVFATNVTARLVSAAGSVRLLPMASAGGTAYAATLSGAALTPGRWRVAFQAAGKAGVTDYPDARTLDVCWFPVAASGTELLHLPERTDVLNGLVTHRSGSQTADVSLVEGHASGTRALRLVSDGVDAQGAAAGYSLPFSAGHTPLGTEHFGLRVEARGAETGARAEIGFRMRSGQGLGCNVQVGGGWSETVVPFSKMVPLWGLPSVAAFRWQEVERISVLTGAWLWRTGKPGRQVLDLASVAWCRLEPAFPLAAADGALPWSLWDVEACLRAHDWSHELRRWRTADAAGREAVHLGADSFDGERDCVSLRVACDGKTFAKLWQTDGLAATLVVRARAACPKTTSFELALIEAGGASWGTNMPLTGEWQTQRIPLSTLRLFTQWDKDMASRAGPHPRLSQVESVNICFGKWLFPAAASEPHGVEIAEIGVVE